MMAASERSLPNMSSWVRADREWVWCCIFSAMQQIRVAQRRSGMAEDLKS